jgi:hypothetical protein
MYIPSNHGADETVIYYIGLKGEYTPVSLIFAYDTNFNDDDNVVLQVNRDIVITNYELRPNPAKNQALGEEATGRHLL